MKNISKMTTSIFSQKSESFLIDELCICLDDFTNKILTDAPQETIFFKDMIDTYLAIDFYSNDDNPLTPKQSRENKKMFESALKYDENISKLAAYPNASNIYESLYFTLRSYTKEGLLGVWYHQDTLLSWYPKVIITKNFGSRDVLDSLDDIVTIYRGTSEDEFNSNKFGQAWSLDKDVAYHFAFSFYKKKSKYICTKRVVIQAQININNIYHYRKAHGEAEVVINPIKLIDGSIQVLECKKLTTT